MNNNETSINFSEENILFVRNEQIKFDSNKGHLVFRKQIEPWLTAIFQSEHLNLLVGSGLILALVDEANAMDRIEFSGRFENIIKNYAEQSAKSLDRGQANFEDDLRTAIELLRGYKILGKTKNVNSLRRQINNKLKELIESVFQNEKKFISGGNLLFLKRFLISFASRTATKDRLHIFTTNYDRFIEYGLDKAGILTIDRFIGKIKPIFRLNRLEFDYHYNPPGIRGEPRYLEGVVRLTKLHGSLDWRFDTQSRNIYKEFIPFGHGEIKIDDPYEQVVIYPNAYKGIDTAFFPYSELFRDFSIAICRPNSVLVTYGYGFGDSHINKIISNMLTIPSTHLVIISFDKANDRIQKFIEKENISQITLLVGNEVAKLENLVNYYLPKPAIDKISDRMYQILEKRNIVERENKEDRKENESGI